MTTPQQPRTRNRQKARRSKQLAAWRDKNAAEKSAASAAPPAKPSAK
jgi:hypothetical protein